MASPDGQDSSPLVPPSPPLNSASSDAARPIADAAQTAHFIKLVGAPSPNLPDQFVVPSPSRVVKGPVVDVLDASSDEPFTLEPFEALIRAHAMAGKEFILARVTTVDPSDESRSYYSYYNAHFINKVLFRTQPEAGLLHRMRARNPLTNTVIVGDVHYFSITPESVLATLALATQSHAGEKEPSPTRPSLHDILRTATGRSPTTNAANNAMLIDPPTPKSDTSSSSTDTSPSGFGIHGNGVTGSDRLAAFFTHGNFSFDHVSAYVQGFLPLQADASNNAASLGRPPSPAKSLFIPHSSDHQSQRTRSRSPDSFRSTDVRSARVRFTLKPSFELEMAKESARKAKMANGEVELSKVDLGWRRTGPGPAGGIDAQTSQRDSVPPTLVVTKRYLYSHSFANSPGAVSSPTEWMRAGTRVSSDDTMSHTPTPGPISGLAKRIPRKGSTAGTGSLPPHVVTTLDKPPRLTKSKLSDNALAATAAGDGTGTLQTEQAAPLTFNLLFHSTDDDFLMHASIRSYFKANALEPNDAVLFTLTSSTHSAPDTGSRGADHPLLDGIQVYEFEEGDGDQSEEAAPEPDFGTGVRGFAKRSLWKLGKLSAGVKFLILIYFPLGFLLVKMFVPEAVFYIVVFFVVLAMVAIAIFCAL
ncbi:hypothetical protein M427DRAFT_71792 [Gonapodya prolifera JEL478]|uniref:Uncharacterized protein n=1 Tax=Gonapodya prolifera (strain JEL478) TaxID=1344416 RepID=A0A139A7U8_GONPJ|nr:hypothetical protein M427DRAFT_71792 [Gonapodya prolifera JEL478]|eukprot:KXS12860.1 hypothetical protein M427DRAFT_71792 [Gonapodya prolifera JEL478]